LHEYALGWACQDRRLRRSRRQEGHRHAAAVCAKVASGCPRSGCPRSGQLLAHGERAFAHEKGLFGTRKLVAKACRTRRSPSDGVYPRRPSSGKLRSSTSLYPGTRKLVAKACRTRLRCSMTECRCGARQERAARREGAVSRVSPEFFWGSAIFRPAWPTSILRVGSEILV